MDDKTKYDNTDFTNDDLKLLYTLGEALGDMPAADETQAAWERFEALRRAEGRKRRRLRIMIATAVAAAAVVVAVVFMPWGGLSGVPDDGGAYTAAKLPQSVTRSTKGGTTTVATPPAATTEVMLPDGTTVLLAAGSKIEYPESFDGAPTREVKLGGMARFNVKPDKSKPFIVQAEGLTTKVLGTVFDVRSYPGTSPTVTLYSGRVSVEADGGRRPAILKPGQQAVFGGKRGITVASADVRAADGWTHGMFIFDDARLQDVVNEIGSWYKKSVVFRSREHVDTRVHFSLPRTIPIEDVLRALRDMGITRLRYDGEKIEVM